MDKTRQQILQEEIDKDYGKWDSVVIPRNVVYEAMKEFGKQCYIAGALAELANTDREIQVYTEYLSKLERKR